MGRNLSAAMKISAGTASLETAGRLHCEKSGGERLRMMDRKNSLRELAQLQNRMNSLFDKLLGPEGAASSQMADVSWIPAADVYETQDSYFVEMELPGVAMENVEVVVQDNILRISGEKRTEEFSGDYGMQRMERYFGPFFREFSFPDYLADADVEATLKDGLLLLKVPKKTDRKRVRVE